jgi:hypothetical protein
MFVKETITLASVIINSITTTNITITMTITIAITRTIFAYAITFMMTMSFATVISARFIILVFTLFFVLLICFFVNCDQFVVPGIFSEVYTFAKTVVSIHSFA